MSVVKLEVKENIRSRMIESFGLCPVSRIEEFYKSILDDGFELFLGVDGGLSIGLFWNGEEIGEIPLQLLADNSIDDNDAFDAPFFLREIADALEKRMEGIDNG